jgi:hypothetical protein
MTKRSEEIAIEIKENERLYEKTIQESKKIIELQEKEYQHLLSKASLTKKQQLIKAGKILEKYKLVEREKISGKLQRDFKGYIAPGTIRKAVMEEGLEWTHKAKGHPGNTGGRTKPISYNVTDQTTTTKPLTKDETQYVQAVERELITDQTIQRLIYEWTNKSTAQQGQVVDRTPKGKHWSNVLAEESTDFMRQLAYQMTISALGRRLEDIRIIKNIADKFGDILYEVYETRKKTESLESA